MEQSDSFFKCLSLYVISDRKLTGEDKFLPALECAMKAGARCIQLREKDLSVSDLRSLALQVKKCVERYNGFLFINDRADLAYDIGADGVHLTEKSSPVREVKKKFPGLKIGVSTHSLDRAKEAESQGAEFITFGPVYETPSKRKYGPPQGVSRLSEVAGKTGIPVLALGGVKVNNLSEVLNAGAHGIALISGIWQGSDVFKNTLEFSNILLRGQNS